MNKDIEVEIEDMFPSEKEMEEFKKLAQVPAIIEVQPVDQSNTAAPVLQTTDTDMEKVEKDFEYAREKIVHALESSDDVLQTAAAFANGTADAESISSYANVLRSIIEGSSKLLELHAKLKTMKKDENKKSETNITNNTMILTTDEMIRMIKGELKK